MECTHSYIHIKNGMQLPICRRVTATACDMMLTRTFTIKWFWWLSFWLELPWRIYSSLKSRRNHAVTPDQPERKHTRSKVRGQKSRTPKVKDTDTPGFSWRVAHWDGQKQKRRPASNGQQWMDEYYQSEINLIENLIISCAFLALHWAAFCAKIGPIIKFYPNRQIYQRHNFRWNIRKNR